jgi:methionyl-tRNA formyltransferase
MSKRLVLSDNYKALSNFSSISEARGYDFEYRHSKGNEKIKSELGNRINIKPLDVAKSEHKITKEYNLIISLHCKQIFPKKIVDNIRCINVHPGYNPYNRGLYPQVFSIINGKPCGVTIHEMDENIDSGPVIARRKVDIEKYDTSKDVYDKIIKLEKKMIKKYIDIIMDNSYEAKKVKRGNYNGKKDFKELCKIDINEKGKFGNFLDRLRALTHGKNKNAYFKDGKGNKIYVRIELEENTNNGD